MLIDIEFLIENILTVITVNLFIDIYLAANSKKTLYHKC